MSRGAWIPIRTFSPMIERTLTSMSSPIMMDWLDLRVSTSTVCRLPAESARLGGWVTPPSLPQTTLRRGYWARSDLPWGLHLNRFATLPACMSRRSLRPQLNQIRSWVRQGRTDAWIAHQLEVTVQQIQAFKREHDLEADGDAGEGAPEEVDLRAEDDAAIAAQLEAEA